MANQFILIKEVALRNNCPICYNNDGLNLSFKQRVLDTKFYKSVTKETKHFLNCKTCKSAIYPVQWTDDIEQVIKYQEKAFTPKKSTLKLKTASWILLVAILSVMVIALIMYQKL